MCVCINIDRTQMYIEPRKYSSYTPFFALSQAGGQVALCAVALHGLWSDVWIYIVHELLNRLHHVDTHVFVDFGQEFHRCV